MTEWIQYDPKHFFDDFKIKQSTTKLKIDIHKMILPNYRLKVQLDIILKKNEKYKQGKK